MRYKISLFLLYGVFQMCQSTTFEVGAMIEVDNNVMKQIKEYMKQNKINKEYTKPNETGIENIESRRNIKDYIKEAVATIKAYDKSKLCDVFNVAIDKVKRFAVNNDDTDKAILKNLKVLEKIPCNDIGKLLNETILALTGKKYKGTTDWLQLTDSNNVLVDTLKKIASSPSETLRKRSYNPDEVVRKTIRNILKVINKIHGYINEKAHENKNILRQPGGEPHKPASKETRKPFIEEQYKLLAPIQTRPLDELQIRPSAEVQNKSSAEVHNMQSEEVKKGSSSVIQHKPSAEFQRRPSRVRRRPKKSRIQHRPSIETHQRPLSGDYHQVRDTSTLTKRPRNRHRSKRTRFETKNYDPSPTSDTETTFAPLHIPKKPKKKVTEQIQKNTHRLDEVIKPIISILLGSNDTSSEYTTTTTENPLINLLLGGEEKTKSEEFEKTTDKPLFKNNRIVLKFQR